MKHDSKIWQDALTGEIYQGEQPLLQLAPKQRATLECFINNPNVYLTKTEIIDCVWPDTILREGVSDGALYQQIRLLRRRLQQYAPKHAYIETWRGSPEGGYRFIPDGVVINTTQETVHTRTPLHGSLVLSPKEQMAKSLSVRLLVSWIVNFAQKLVSNDIWYDKNSWARKA